MFGELETFVAMVRDEPLRQLLESIVNDASINQRLKTVLAAMKIDHAFRGGLLEHVLSLCYRASAWTANSRLNLDWLIAGAILHDLGKIETLELTGVRFAYTTRGQLIEDVTLGLETLERHVGRFLEFPLELKTILQHFIVSHHGDLDKGALRRPMPPEAFALSLLDLMDARLEQVFRLIDSAPAGEEFTSYIPSRHSNVSCSADSRNRQNRVLNRKLSYGGKAA
jgi:3'-5' exoribonuclease